MLILDSTSQGVIDATYLDGPAPPLIVGSAGSGHLDANAVAAPGPHPDDKEPS